MYVIFSLFSNKYVALIKKGETRVTRHPEYAFQFATKEEADTFIEEYKCLREYKEYYKVKEITK